MEMKRSWDRIISKEENPRKDEILVPNREEKKTKQKEKGRKL